MRPLALALLAALAAPAAAQKIAPAEYASRRAALLAQVDSGVVVAFGAREPAALWTQFRPLPAFRYLTDFAEPDAVLVLVKRSGASRALVFVETPGPRQQLYLGISEDSASVAARAGLARRDISALRPALDSLAAAGLPFYTLRDFASADAAGVDTVTLGASFMRAFAGAHPGLKVVDAHPMLDRMRARKSPAELALLRKAIDATVASQRAAMRTVRAGMSEREVQAVIDAGFLRAGAEGPSFGSIVGSGPNSTTLHYMKNDRTMKAGDVVVMDVGASYEGYAADVTRTVPVSGRFTPEQRAVYQLVRDAQAAAERVLKVGASRDAWRNASDSVIAAGLTRLGLIESPDATFDPPWSAECARNARLCKQLALWMPHGLGHGIGLEVHDPATFYEEDGAFKENEIFTIEPGIYVNPEALKLLPDTPKNRAMLARVRPMVAKYQHTGVRIEDDYLLTSKGLEWLSKAPREVQEVEAAMGAVP